MQFIIGMFSVERYWNTGTGVTSISFIEIEVMGATDIVQRNAEQVGLKYYVLYKHEDIELKFQLENCETLFPQVHTAWINKQVYAQKVWQNLVVVS